MSQDRSRRDRIARWVLAVLVLIAVLAIPTRCSLGSRQSYVDEANAARAAATELNDRASKAEAAAADDSFTARHDALVKAVPPTADLAGLLAAVSSAAATSGVTITSVSPSQNPTSSDKGTNQLSTWTLTMAVEGTPAALESFLDQLAGLDRLVVVDSVNQQASAEGTVTASVTARFFSLEGS
jgi:Tfp pilus assembly protein PilO